MEKKSLAKKIFNFTIVKLLIGLIAILAIYSTCQYWFAELLKNTTLTKELQNLFVSIISSIIVIVSYKFLFKIYEKRIIKELSFENFFKNLVIGILLGTLLQSLTILVIYLNNGYSIITINSFIFIIPALAMSFSSAIFEEILMRGIIFRIIEEKLGSYFALIISAILFGAMHLANPNSSIIAAIGLSIQAGLLLASAYIYSRNLWLPIALHFAWNFTQSGIFGAKVSGNTIEKTLITSKIEGANWFTGGEFGPEGSIQATIFCLIVTIILLVLSYKENKFIKPSWIKTTNG